MSALALVDLEILRVPTHPQRAATLSELHRSLSEYGAVFFKNDALTPEILQQAVELTKKLFALPAGIKEQYSSKPNGGRTGFIPYATESADAQFEPDPKETWHISREPKQATKYSEFYIPNLWPQEIEEFHPFFTQFYKQMDPFAVELIRFSLEALYKSDPIPQIMTDHNSVIRMTKYVHDTHWNERLDFLANEHRDVDLFTLHLATSAAGCEFLKDGEWYSPLYPEGYILASVGTMLDRLSNGKYPAPLHRVKNLIGLNEQRIFLGYFLNPSPDVLIESHVTPQEDKKYDAVLNLALLLQRASDTRVL
jgi:isopenicillin N synthase-like dioxygenase